MRNTNKIKTKFGGHEQLQKVAIIVPLQRISSVEVLLSNLLRKNKTKHSPWKIFLFLSAGRAYLYIWPKGGTITAPDHCHQPLTVSLTWAKNNLPNTKERFGLHLKKKTELKLFSIFRVCRVYIIIVVINWSHPSGFITLVEQLYGWDLCDQMQMSILQTSELGSSHIQARKGDAINVGLTSS